MAYVKNQAISGTNPGNSLMSAIHPLLISEGWIQIKETTPSGTYRVRTYKSPGSTNQCGYDWYLVFRWNTVGFDDYFNVFAGENFDYDSDTLIRATVGNNATTSHDASSDGALWGDISVNWYPTEVITSNLTGGGTVNHTISIKTPFTMNINISVTPDHFVMFPQSGGFFSSYFFTVDTANYTDFFNGGTGTPVMGYIGFESMSPGVPYIGQVYIPSSVWYRPDEMSKWKFRVGNRWQFKLQSSHLPSLQRSGLVAKAYKPRIFANLCQVSGPTDFEYDKPIPPDSGLSMSALGSSPNIEDQAWESISGATIVGDAIDVLMINNGYRNDTFNIGDTRYVICYTNGLAVEDES